jgi:signal transduction histidine kinase
VSRLSLRVRLAALIGLMLVVCGAALLTISYGLVSSNLSGPPANKQSHASSAPATSGTQRRIAKGTPSKGGTRPAGPKGAAQTALRKRTLDQLVTQYLAVLGGVVLVAVTLGWLLAGRLLRSVRRITSVAGRVTGRNLNERLGLEGPRDEPRELADAFDGMLARLDGVFRAQRRFVTDASHELRTPLAAMRAEVEVLAADPKAAAADVEAATLVLRRQLHRSEELIEALLALARSEPELLVRERVDVAEIAREALEDTCARMAGRRLRIDHQLAPAVVDGDRRLLTLLVGNLLDNAINHNRDDGWIRLQTAVDRDIALLTVANSGHLVGAEEVQELAQAFRRGGRARVGDGQGLGLAIVQAVARAHQGAMTIQHENEGGLRIDVRLPLAASEATDTLAARDGAVGEVAAGDRSI